MELELSPVQRLLKESAGELLRSAWSVDAARAAQETGTRYSAELWRKLAQAGLVGLSVPQQHGGAGGTFQDEAVVAYELGRHAVASPFVSTAIESATLISRAGSDAQRDDLLPRISDGSRIVSFAFLEEDLSWDPLATRLSARVDGDLIRLDGRKVFVQYGTEADTLIVLARRADDLVAVLVDAAAVERRAMANATGASYAEVTFDPARATAGTLLGGGAIDAAVVERALARGAIAQAAYAMGINRHALDIAVEYSKHRVQFGQPIGAFQGVQHRLADMLSYVDAADLLVHQAAWALAETADPRREVAIAKAFTNEVTWRVLLDSHDVFGGVGFMRSHELDVYTRLGVPTMLQYGDTNLYRERVAAAIGL